MTNFEYYKDKIRALEAYEKSSGELVYNLQDGPKFHSIGTSAGRFVSWLYKEYVDERDELIEKMRTRIVELNNEIQELKKGVIDAQSVYTPLEYESLRDKALDMAATLKKIDSETRMCASCKGDSTGAYSTDAYLKTICEILYSSQGYHNGEL